MKRFHVHVAVPDIAASIRFYSTLFGAEPSVAKPDYAKWMLEDPRVNFAISERNSSIGVNHLGLQVDSGEELEALHGRLEQASRDVKAEVGVSCCYAQSDKYWVKDPAGVAWESFHSLGSVPFFGDAAAEPAAVNARCGSGAAGKKAATGCCAGSVATTQVATAAARSASCCS